MQIHPDKFINFSLEHNDFEASVLLFIRYILVCTAVDFRNMIAIHTQHF